MTQVTRQATVLLAPNPGPMTLDGTNSWIVRAPGADKSVIIDPGPAETAHLRELAAQGPVAVILITHHHHDHTEGAAELAAVTGAPVRALDPAWCDGAEALHDGERIELAPVLVDHDEGRLTVRDVLGKRYYYGRSIPAFAARHEGAVGDQGKALLKAYADNRGRLVRDPAHAAGMVVLRGLEVLGYAAGARRGRRDAARSAA